MDPLAIPRFLINAKRIKAGKDLGAIKRTFLAKWLKEHPHERARIHAVVLLGEEHAPLAIELYETAKVDGRHRPFATVQLKEEFTKCPT